MANRKPRGTRTRVAMRPQLGTAASQKMARRPDHFLRADLQQPFVRPAVVRERRLALGMAERDGLCAERPGALGIGGSEESDHRDVERCGEVQRAGIAADKNFRAPGEGDELRDRTTDGKRVARRGTYDRLSKSVFTGTEIHQRFQVVFRQSL